MIINHDNIPGASRQPAQQPAQQIARDDRTLGRGMATMALESSVRALEAEVAGLKGAVDKIMQHILALRAAASDAEASPEIIDLNLPPGAAWPPVDDDTDE